jgi:sarcosine/dimethylglycine N-methyltransferase
VNREAHPYVTNDLWAGVENALLAAGKDLSQLTSSDTAPLDHFHTGGLEASKDLLRLASVAKPSEILDLGAGIGGASRFLAEATQASIFSLDFSPEFCDVNRRLCHVIANTGDIQVTAGDATALPFRAASFDLVWMQQAGMNIADKDALFSEIARVLRPGAVYAFQEIVAGAQPGPLDLPVAWAATQKDSNLEPAGAMRSRLQSLGLKELSFEDVTSSLLPGLQERVRNVGAKGPPLLGVHLLSTNDLLPILQGMLSSVLSGRIAFVRGVFKAA